jgi:hypothetical protein
MGRRAIAWAFALCGVPILFSVLFGFEMRLSAGQLPSRYLVFTAYFGTFAGLAALGAWSILGTLRFGWPAKAVIGTTYAFLVFGVSIYVEILYACLVLGECPA